MSGGQRTVLILGLIAGCLFSSFTHAAPAIGVKAPDFTLTDINGKAHSLSDYKGSVVVLEWNNPQCPYVQKFYRSGTMQTLQRAAASHHIIWLRIDSEGQYMPGYLDPAAAKALVATDGSDQTAFLLDPEGTVGKLYGATVTPDMAIIDARGIVRYRGAVDNAPSADPSTLINARNYIGPGMTAILNNRPADPPLTRAYGCAIQYAPGGG